MPATSARHAVPLGNVLHDRFTAVSGDGSALTLAPSLLLTNETGVNGNIPDELSSSMVGRVVFEVPLPGYEGAEMLFYRNDIKPSAQPADRTQQSDLMVAADQFDLPALLTHPIDLVHDPFGAGTLGQEVTDQDDPRVGGVVLRLHHVQQRTKFTSATVDVTDHQVVHGTHASLHATSSPGPLAFVGIPAIRAEPTFEPRKRGSSPFFRQYAVDHCNPVALLGPFS